VSLVIYLLCFVTSSLCAWLLLRGFARTRVRLLLWSGLCFCFMALNNAILVLDVHVFPSRSLIAARLLSALLGIVLLLFGLVWETRR
jgi:hypothetical protein